MAIARTSTLKLNTERGVAGPIELNTLTLIRGTYTLVAGDSGVLDIANQGVPNGAQMFVTRSVGAGVQGFIRGVVVVGPPFTVQVRSSDAGDTSSGEWLIIG